MGLAEKINVVQTVTLHEVILNTLGELSQFRDGLEALAVGKALKEHGDFLRGFYSNDKSLKEPLTAGTFIPFQRVFCYA